MLKVRHQVATAKDELATPAVIIATSKFDLAIYRRHLCRSEHGCFNTSLLTLNVDFHGDYLNFCLETTVGSWQMPFSFGTSPQAMAWVLDILDTSAKDA